MKCDSWKEQPRSNLTCVNTSDITYVMSCVSSLTRFCKKLRKIARKLYLETLRLLKLFSATFRGQLKCCSDSFYVAFWKENGHVKYLQMRILSSRGIIYPPSRARWSAKNLRGASKRSLYRKRVLFAGDRGEFSIAPDRGTGSRDNIVCARTHTTRRHASYLWAR